MAIIADGGAIKKNIDQYEMYYKHIPFQIYRKFHLSELKIFR